MAKIPDAYTRQGGLKPQQGGRLRPRAMSARGGGGGSAVKINPGSILSAKTLQLPAPIDTSRATHVEAANNFAGMMVDLSMKIAERQTKVDAADRISRMNEQVNKLLYDPETGLETMSGKAYVDAAPAVRSQIEGIYKNTMDGADPRSRYHIADYLYRERPRMDEQIASKKVVEQKNADAYAEQQYDMTFQTTLVNNYTNPNDAINAIYTNKTHYQQMYPGEEGTVKAAKSIKSGFDSVIKLSLAQNNEQGLNLANQYIGALTNPDLKELFSGEEIAAYQQTVFKAREHVQTNNYQQQRQQLELAKMSRAENYLTPLEAKVSQAYTIRDPQEQEEALTAILGEAQGYQDKNLITGGELEQFKGYILKTDEQNVLMHREEIEEAYDFASRHILGDFTDLSTITDGLPRRAAKEMKTLLKSNRKAAAIGLLAELHSSIDSVFSDRNKFSNKLQKGTYGITVKDMKKQVEVELARAQGIMMDKIGAVDDDNLIKVGYAAVNRVIQKYGQTSVNPNMEFAESQAPLGSLDMLNHLMNEYRKPENKGKSLHQESLNIIRQQIEARYKGMGDIDAKLEELEQVKLWDTILTQVSRGAGTTQSASERAQSLVGNR